MNKAEFLNELSKRLSGLPQSDIEERVSFYTEMIDDRMEDGMSEEEAVAQIGPVDKVVETIMSEIPLSRLVKAKVKPEKKMPVWAIVLLVIGFPVWFPIIISLFSVVFSLYLTLWIIVITLYSVDLALAVSGIASVASSVIAFVSGEGMMGAALLGAGLAGCALSVLMFIGCGYVVKGVVFITGKALLGIKSMFIGKEN